MRTANEIQTTIDTIESAIETAKQAITDKQDEIDTFDKSQYYTEEMYESALEDMYSDSVDVCGMSMNPVYVLKMCDPTAYNCGMGDMVDSMDNADFEEFNELEKELEALDDELTELEKELEDELTELEDLEREEDEDEE